MKLTVDEHPKAVARYAHIPRARRWSSIHCRRVCPGTRYTCTREAGHRGPHVAHGFFRRIRAVWEPSSAAAPSPRSAKRRSRPKVPIGLRGAGSDGLFRGLRGFVGRVFSSGEELALFAFFIAFVWFAIDWLRLIFQ